MSGVGSTSRPDHLRPGHCPLRVTHPEPGSSDLPSDIGMATVHARHGTNQRTRWHVSGLKIPARSRTESGRKYRLDCSVPRNGSESRPSGVMHKHPAIRRAMISACQAEHHSPPLPLVPPHSMRQQSRRGKHDIHLLASAHVLGGIGPADRRQAYWASSRCAHAYRCNNLDRQGSRWGWGTGSLHGSMGKRSELLQSNHW